jgi:four helix bundle protein
MLRTLKELKVWQKGYALCQDLYRLTARLPDDQKYGLASQLRRAAGSVPSNIAEGYGRRSRKDYLRSEALNRMVRALIESWKQKPTD